MPKLKTSRAAAKRFKKTGTGKLVRNKAYKSHILTKKSTKRKRNLRNEKCTIYMYRRTLCGAGLRFLQRCYRH